ncbi:hypothetical protein ACSV5M_02990 [Cellvibrio sp. ARAG 10.3]|uniref:hypothetical protein n=1 Tax=Cellvibrio sp. ARAG 10.3 TaxID=3451358 RepID=UPI003F468941
MAISKKNNLLLGAIKGTAETTQVFEYKASTQYLDSKYLTTDKGQSINEYIGVLNKSPIYTAKFFDSEVFEKPNEKFGTISHINVADINFLNAKNGIDDLRGEFDLNKEETIVGKLKKFFDEIKDSWVYKNNNFYNFSFVSKSLEPRDDPWESYKNLEAYDEPGKPPLDPKALAEGMKVNNHTALFSTGKIIRKDILLIERLRRELVNLHKFQQKILAEKRTALGKVETEIPQHHQTLANLNRQRIRSEGDYQVVRLLVAENWADVEKAYAERARILNNHKGLFYARVRETPINLRPVTPLPLRYGSLDDLVPGYPLEDIDLPEDLQVFMEAVLDISMNDWVSLHNQYTLLPTRPQLQRMLGVRQARLGYRINQSYQADSKMVSVKLGRLRNQNQMLMSDLLHKTFIPSASILEYQRNAAQLISLEDLLNGPPHRLRGLAETQRNKLDQATHSLLKELRKVAPSIRLQWAEAAELDTLNVKQPTQWPGIGQAEAKDLNGIRTLVELIQWWWRQLTTNASSTSHSAVRNLIRATLMLAAADDPDQILRGNLATVPGRFVIGEALRLTLNKEALPGTLLQMVSPANVLIGTLRIDDFDDKGAVATLTQLITQDAVPSTAYTVTGYMMPGKKR